MEFYKSSQVEIIRKYKKYPHKLIEDMYGIKLKYCQLIYFYTIGKMWAYLSKQGREQRLVNKVIRPFKKINK